MGIKLSPKQKVSILVVFIISLLIIAGFIHFVSLAPSRQLDSPVAAKSTSVQSCGLVKCADLNIQYDSAKQGRALKFDNAKDALAAFRSQTAQSMGVQRISTYVPGKLPREDGDPYFIGRGVVDKQNNICIIGYMNLVSGAVESHRDVCVIYD